ncbi:MAG: hypothetical protein ACRDBO_14640 [Lachnospiraceae bacterium]
MIIRISTRNDLEVFEYPSGSWDGINDRLCELIGNSCQMVERVTPKRLYTDFGAIAQVTQTPGESVCMLVDEEGRLKVNHINWPGSILYQSDIHGQPIVGNILFVGQKWEGSGISFCGIDTRQFGILLPRLQKVVDRAKKAWVDK